MRALSRLLDPKGSPEGAQQLPAVGRRLPVGFVLIGSIPARAALLRPCVWEGSAGMRRGDVAWNRRDGGTARGESPRFLPHCKEKSLMEQSIQCRHDHQSPFKSKHPSSSIGILGYPRIPHLTLGIIWWRRFVHLKHRALGSLGKVMCALSLGKLRQKQQTRFVLSCARNQGLNTSITSLSSLWPRTPPAPLPAAGGAELHWERKVQSLGASHAFHNPWCPQGLQQRPEALSTGKARILGSHCYITAPEEACRGRASAAR